MRISVRFAPALADDLVSGSEGNQMREAFERNLVAVIHVPCNSVF